MAAWNDVSSALLPGDHVTVDGEKADGVINPDSYFATVLRVNDDGTYDLQQPGSPTSSRDLAVKRKRMRHRKRSNAVCGGTSVDRTHD